VLALGRDHCHQIVPGFHEGFGALILKPCGQRVDFDVGIGEFRQNLFAIAAIGRQDCAELVVHGESFQCLFGHRVNSERRGEAFYVEDVGGSGIFCSRAGPKKTLGAGAGVVGALPAVK